MSCKRVRDNIILYVPTRGYKAFTNFDWFYQILGWDNACTITNLYKALLYGPPVDDGPWYVTVTTRLGQVTIDGVETAPSGGARVLRILCKRYCSLNTIPTCVCVCVCVEVCGGVWRCAEVCVEMCAGVGRCVWRCVEVCGCAEVCVEMCGCVWVCVESIISYLALYLKGLSVGECSQHKITSTISENTH